MQEKKRIEHDIKQSDELFHLKFIFLRSILGITTRHNEMKEHSTPLPVEQRNQTKINGHRRLYLAETQTDKMTQAIQLLVLIGDHRVITLGMFEIRITSRQHDLLHLLRRLHLRLIGQQPNMATTLGLHTATLVLHIVHPPLIHMVGPTILLLIHRRILRQHHRLLRLRIPLRQVRVIQDIRQFLIRQQVEQLPVQDILVPLIDQMITDQILPR